MKEIPLKMLTSPITDQSLADFVRWLDLGGGADIEEGLNEQLITRSIIAMGYCLLERIGRDGIPGQNVLNTLKAASEYVLSPSEDNKTAYFRSATNSYPYGAGDGCFSIDELREEGMKLCEVGTGCRSGAGSLMSNGLDHKKLFQEIADELIPWLKGESDPVLKRATEGW